MSTRVRTIDFLPEIFKTKPNEQFLTGTLDQLSQQPKYTKIQGYIGNKFGYGVSSKDHYIVEPDKTRTNYQLDPAVIFKKKDTNTAVDLITYPGIIDSLKVHGGITSNHNNLFTNEFYSWDSFTDLDKLINYTQYYWLPLGPEPVNITTTNVYTKVEYNVVSNPTNYSFNSAEVDLNYFNPVITLVRGGVYQFVTDQKTNFWIQSQPGKSGTDPVKPNISTREVFGVDNNGTKNGIITFTVPFADAQDEYDLPGNTTIDLVSTGTVSSLQGKEAAVTAVDNIVDLNGKTVVFYNGSLTTEYYLITYVSDGFGGFNLSLSVAGSLPTNEKITIKYGTNYIGRSFVKNAFGELILIPPNTARLDTLYYQDGTINGKTGKIKIIDDFDTDYINLDDVLGRPSYTSPNGIKFTNGLKVTFSGNIFPESYKTGEYYVEGVGTAIQLIPLTDLIIPEQFSQTVSTPYDGEVYDSVLYGETYFYPKDKDYITINRSAANKNAWSRSNRWFHHDVLRTTIDNTITAPLCQEALGNSASMAKRPIIEFYPTLKMFNMGTNSKGSVNYINFSVTDAFTEVAGNNEFVPDGNTSYVFDGMTVIFAGDTNLDVRNKIYVARLTETVNTTIVPVSAFMSKVGTGPYLVKFAIPYQTYAPVVGKRYQVMSSANAGYNGIFTVTASTNTTVTLSYPSNPGIFSNTGVTNLLSDIEITLSEAPNGNIAYNDQSSILFGVEYGGTTFYFDGLNWQQGQQKERVNQPPLFDVFDYNGISFGDAEYYPGTDFTGCTLFEYATGTGANDPILGFPLKYTSLSSLGDIVFDVSLNTQQFDYALNGVSKTEAVKTGYVYSYTNRTDYNREIGWQTAIEDSFQYQVFNLTYTGVPVEPKFVCDVAKKESDTTAWPTIVVYVDNQRTSEFTVSTTSNTTTIILNATPSIGAAVDIMLYSDQASATGYYQIPSNLDHNPFNTPVTNLSLGDVRGHYKSICNNAPNLVGSAFGPNNFRDLGNLVPYGTKIIQNSASIALGASFLRNNDINFFDATNFNAIEYNKYKALIVDTLSTLDFSYYTSDSEILDEVVSIITSAKSESGPFFWSDMLPAKNINVSNTYTFKTSLDTSIFPLSKIYDFTSANYNGVLIYLTRRINGNLSTRLLVKDIDYVISSEQPDVVITYDLINDDIIVINEYDQTYGSYVPNTPTKVGLYPAFIPTIELDSTYLNPTYFLKGHDGSYTKLYGSYENEYLTDARDRIMLEFELRVYNNLKVTSTLPLDYADIVPGQFRTLNTDYIDFENLYNIYFLNWVGLNRIDYKTHYYDSTDEFTWNYIGAKLNFNNQYVKQGNWRGLYLWLYDTANPDTKPWEMLGLPNKPTWWEQRYGTAPYTSDNTYMWTEISEGYVWNNGNPYVASNRIRPQLLQILPVDTNGNLLSPFTNLLSSYDVDTFSAEWNSGDMSPAEYSYRKSSTWPFDLMSMMALTKPAKFFALTIDIDLYKFNKEFNQYLVSDRLREIPSDIIVYGANDTTASHSYLNWLVDYSNQFGVDGSETVTQIFKNIDVRLTYRLAGFSDQDMLKFFLETGSTNGNSSSMLIPDDSYKILLYNNEPVDTIVYSSVVIQRTDNGYKVYGNKQVHAYFTAFVSKSGLYDTVTVNNLSVLVPKGYYDKTIIIPYGYEFTSIEKLVDFLKGYGLYLTSQGMQFNDIENGLELNWDQMIAEVLYWVQSGWEVGSTVNVNPAANILSVQKDNVIVQPLTIRKQNFVLNQNLIPIQLSDLSIHRQDTLFSVKALNTGDAISYFNANLSAIEHVVIFDNETIFNDLMFNLVTGLRQQRLFVKGAKTAEWNGLVNASGFILNQDNVVEWVPNAKYIKGEIVKYKNEYWAANKLVIQPSSTFNYNDWDKTSYNDIQKGLLPNPSTRSAESLLYYDSNRANLSNDADLLAFSLIGYRPRKYLTDADLDDATQVNLFKTMIETKGTNDSINILNGINVNDHTLTYSSHENWAIKTSEYGGLLNQNFVEFTLDESKLTGNPSIVSLVSDVPVAGSQQQIQFYNLKNYGRIPSNNNVLPQIGYSSIDEQIPSAGYVNINDVIDLGYTINQLSDANISSIYKNDYLWIANKYNKWDIYTPYSTGAQVIRITNNLNGTVSIFFDKNHGLSEGQALGIVNFDTRIDGYYNVELVVDLTTIIVSLTLDSSVTSVTGKGLSFLLQSQRVYNARDINGLPLLNAEYISNKVWVDHNVYGNWTVYEKTLNYVHDSLDKIVATTEFGTQVAYIPLLGYIVTDPAEGKLYQFTKTNSGYFLKNTIEYAGTSFGTAMAYSDDLLIVTAPDDVLTQIYVFRIPNETNISLPVLEQTISIAFRVGESLTISGDSNYLWLGLPAYNGVLELQLDSELTYVSTGLTLSSDTILNTMYLTCSGDHVADIPSGQRINFVTTYTLVDQLYVDIDYYPNALPAAITQDYFICQGDVSAEFSSGDRITFSNTGAAGDDSQLLTVYLSSYDVDNDQTYFYTVETIAFNVTAGTNIYKATFNEEGTYTVVTGIYDVSSDTTTFFTTSKIQHSAPTGAKLYFANTNFSYIGALSAREVSLAGDNFGFSLATNYDSTKLFVGAPNNNYISGSTNIQDTGAAYVFDRIVQNIEVQYDQTPYSPLAILLTWTPDRHSKLFVNGVLLERNKYVIFLNYIIIGIINLRAGDIIKISSVEMVLSEQLVNYDNVSDLRQGEKFGYSIACNRMGNEVIVGAPYDVVNDIEEGAVYRFTNASKRYGTMQGVVPANLYDSTYILLNGYRVQLDPTIIPITNMKYGYSGYTITDLGTTDWLSLGAEPQSVGYGSTTGTTLTVDNVTMGNMYIDSQLSSDDFVYIDNAYRLSTTSDITAGTKIVRQLTSTVPYYMIASATATAGTYSVHVSSITGINVGTLLYQSSGSNLSANTYVYVISESISGGYDIIVTEQILSSFSGVNTFFIDPNYAFKTAFNGTGTSGENTLYLTSYTSIVAGSMAEGSGIPDNTYVTAVRNVRARVTATTTSTNLITTDYAGNLVVNEPVKFTVAIGGLSTSTQYYIKSIPSKTTFTVSTTKGGSTVSLSTATGVSYVEQKNVMLSNNLTSDASGDYTFRMAGKAGTYEIDTAQTVSSTVISTMNVGTVFDSTSNTSVIPSGTGYARESARAQQLAQMIRNANITNIFAYATEDDRLVIRLRDYNLGPNNNKLNVSVFNGNYMTQLGFYEYPKSQTITNPHPQQRSLFGYSVKFNENNSFVVGAPTSTRYAHTTFDYKDDADTRNDTVFDNYLTDWEDHSTNSGAVYMYDYIQSYEESLSNIGKYSYAQPCNDTTTEITNPMYGSALDFNNNVVMVGAPLYKPDTDGGRVVVFTNDSGIADWHVYREPDPISNIDKIQKAQLYDNTTDVNLVSLDYIDPLQGKLLGIVRDNLDYIGTGDPAGYNSTGQTKGNVVWNKSQVGKIWFDTSEVRFLDYHQNDVAYNAKYWGQVFPGSTVAVYSWIESTVPPALYTGTGTPYDLAKYAVMFDVDSNNNLIPKYFYWVRDTNTVFVMNGKTLSDAVLTRYISNPKDSGVAFMAPLRPNTYALYNAQEYINNTYTNMHLGFSNTITDSTGHVEFKLIRANYSDDFLPGFTKQELGYNEPIGLYEKYIDSFSGTDVTGAVVPDLNLPKLMKTGIGFRPRQSLFVDRFVALKNYLEYANSIVKSYPINESGNVTFLSVVGGVNPSTINNPEWLGGEKLFFDTTNYWSNIYWWEEGYSDKTRASTEVPLYSDLLRLTPKEGFIAGVSKNSAGKREVYIYTNSQWKRIGVQDGTIQFLSSLWDYQLNQIGFGNDFFDTNTFDEYPSEETRYIIRAINEQLYTGSLFEYKNKSLTLMFEYIQSENIESQNYLPWLNRTSLVDINYNVRELTTEPRYTPDHTSLLEGFVNEVKPYHVVIKEFYLQYTRTEVVEGTVTDFDLPPVYNSSTNTFESPQLVYSGPLEEGKYYPTDPIWNSTVDNKTWFDNFGLTFYDTPNTVIASVARFINPSDPIIVIDNSYGMPYNGVITIENEMIAYTEVDRVTGTLSGLTRGINGTTATSHFAGTPILIDLPSIVVLTPGRNYALTPKVTAYIDTSIYPAPTVEASFVPTMANGKVVGIEIVNPGDGYAIAPEIIIEPSITVTSSKSLINFTSSILVVNSTEFVTGDVVKSEGTSSNGITIIPNNFYYIRVTVSGTQSFITFYETIHDYEKQTNQINFIPSNRLPDDYEHTISITPHVVVNANNESVRGITTTLRFDRTSYRPRISAWLPNQYWAGAHVTFGNDASSPERIYDVGAPLASGAGAGLLITGSTAGDLGEVILTVDYSDSGLSAGHVNGSYMYFYREFDAVTPAIFDGTSGKALIEISRPNFRPGNISNQYTMYIDPDYPGSIYNDGEVFRILGTELGGQTPVNDAYVTINYANIAGLPGGGPIFTASIRGIANGHYGVYYVKVLSVDETSMQIGAYADPNFEIAIPYSSFYWKGNTSYNDYGYLSEPITANFNYAYDTTSIVYYSNALWVCLESNNDSTFDPAKWQLISNSDTIINALDRIEAFYWPTSSMPAREMQQLVSGVTYPNPVYYGNSFAPEDVLPLDMVVQAAPFYPVSPDIVGITYDGTRYIAVGNTADSTFVLVRNDNLTWRSIIISDISLNATGIAYNDSIYVISTLTTDSSVVVSFDLENWVSLGRLTAYDETKYSELKFDMSSVSAPRIPLYSVNYCNDAFYATSSSSEIIRSVNGIEWTSVYNSDSRLSSTIENAKYFESTHFIGYVATGTQQVITSGEGTPAPIIEDRSLIVLSTDGINWTKLTPNISEYQLNDSAANVDNVVIVGNNASVWYSNNAHIWVEGTIDGTPITSNINGVAYGNDIFVAIGDKIGSSADDPGLIMTSTDGAIWTQHSSQYITTNNLHRITFNGTNFCVVGENDTILESSNGINWTDLSSIEVDDPYYIVKGNDFMYGYGPEELVAGVTSDTLLMRVNTTPGATWNLFNQDEVWYYNTGFNMLTRITTPNDNLEVSFEGMVLAPVQVSVFIVDDTTHQGIRLYENIGYTVDWFNNIITLNDAVPSGSSVMIEVYEFGNARELIRSTTELMPVRTDPVTGHSMIDLGLKYHIPIVDVPAVAFAYTPSTGMNKLVYGTDFVIDPTKTNMTLLFNQTYDVTTDYIVFSLFGDSSTPNSGTQYSYSIPEIELFTYDGSTTTWELSNYSGDDNETNAIVEVNGLRLLSSEWSISSGELTVTASLVNGDIVACTTFNDTTREFLTTATSTTLSVTSITSIDVTATPYVMTTSSDIFVSGDDIFIDGAKGSIQLNGNVCYVNRTGANTYELYTDALLTIPVSEVTPYLGGGYTWLSSEIFVAPNPVVPVSMPDMYYIDASKTWVTINGYRVDPSKLKFRDDNRLSIMVEVSAGDTVVVTSKVSGASPNSSAFDIYVNKNGQASVYRTNVEDTTWLTQNADILDTVMHFYDVKHLAEKHVITSNVDSDLLVYIDTNIDDLTNISVYNNTTDDALTSSDFYITKIGGKNAISITTGASVGDSINITMYLGNVVELNGERIKFDTMDLTTNTITGLTRGIDGTSVVANHYTYDIGAGITPRRKLPNSLYYETWNSANYAESGDPLQVSTTQAARFLEIGNY